MYFGGKCRQKLIKNKLITNLIFKYFLKDTKLSEVFKKHKITDHKLQSFLGAYAFLQDNGTMNDVVDRASYNIYLLLFFTFLRSKAIFPKFVSEVYNI